VSLPFSIGTGAGISQENSDTPKVHWEGPSLRVLFAEDDEVNIKFGTSLLKKLGFDVTAVINGRECLAAIEQGAFDLVLMDIQMPVMNGEEALEEIRRKELETSAHLPVIALTAYSLRRDRERFLEHGFDGYLSKPLETKELIYEIKLVMGMLDETCTVVKGEIYG
jgi:CheY-like chemotaxis protein